MTRYERSLVLALVSALVAAMPLPAQQPPNDQPPKVQPEIQLHGDSRSTSHQNPFPDWPVVAATIDEHFKKKKDYRPGDFLSRSTVESLLAELAKLGWTVRDRDAILAQLTPDKDLLTEQFSTPRGREFMRKVSKNPASFEYLQRLSETANGQRQVKDLMKLPNGPDVLAALVSSPQGRDISKRIAAGPKTKNFDKPTGRIYTQAQLVTRLRESYTKELAGGAKAEPAKTPDPKAVPKTK
jgi:hypothetical protein